MKRVFKQISRLLLCGGLVVTLAGCHKDESKPEGDGKTFTVNGVSFEMVAVEGGTFTMGATEEQGDDARDNEKPAHSVTLSDYSIGKYPVTLGLFRAFIDDTNYETDAEKEGWSRVWNGSDNENKNGVNWRCDAVGNERSEADNSYPVVHVSWNDAVAFCEWLSGKTGKKFALPTEAQWEYAARGGNKSKGYKYSGSDELDAVAWYYGNSDEETHAVGIKAPNELGIYDMSGNVYEWCRDWDSDSYYSISEQTDPTGPESGDSRVHRGGGWTKSALCCRVSFRSHSSQFVSGGHIGFRIVLIP